MAIVVPFTTKKPYKKNTNALHIPAGIMPGVLGRSECWAHCDMPQTVSTLRLKTIFSGAKNDYRRRINHGNNILPPEFFKEIIQKCGRDFKNVNQSHSCVNKPSTIDEYISAQPEDLRPILEKIRKAIKKAAPASTEKIAWGMPTFWQGENLITRITKFRVSAGIKWFRFAKTLKRIPFYVFYQKIEPFQ